MRSGERKLFFKNRSNFYRESNDEIKAESDNEREWFINVVTSREALVA